MKQLDPNRLNPFLRDAAVTFVPELTDDQLVRLTKGIAALHPHAMVSRMSTVTAMIHGIPARAATAHEADVATWVSVNAQIRSTLNSVADADTELTSIDVRLPAASPFAID